MAEINNKLHIWLVPLESAGQENDFLANSLAYDVEILDPQATVGDYLQAIEDFQSQTLADCKGCDGCCHERAPLTIADWQLAQANLNQQEYTQMALAKWLANWGDLHFYGQAIDLTIKRLPEGVCQFLEPQEKFCTIHQQRSFTCRSHCCLPKTERAEALRAALINAGEDELVRRLLQIPQDLQPWREQLAGCSLEDYEENPFSSLPPTSWRQAKLRELLDPELWAELFNPLSSKNF